MSEITDIIMLQNNQKCKEILDKASYCIDYMWGKSRYYILPYLNTGSTWNATPITDNILISDLTTALNIDVLKSEGISHIVNLVLGIDSIYPDCFTYLNIPARDIENQDISQYLDQSLNFIRNAIECDGKVLVHCSCGVSRSASIVIAYLIKYHQMNYQEAYVYIKQKRPIVEPNPGFVKQLVEFEERVRREEDEMMNISN